MFRRDREHLKKWKAEGTETENICNVEGLQWQLWNRVDWKELKVYKITCQLQILSVS